MKIGVIYSVVIDKTIVYIYMLFTGCEVRMRKTVPEVLKTARARRARDVFKTEGTVFLIRTEAAGK